MNEMVKKSPPVPTVERLPQTDYDMRIKVVREISLKDFPSASGVELLGDKIAIVGDDYATLLILDEHFQPEREIELFQRESEKGARIPKLEKPDLEATLKFSDSSGDHIFAFGSGSRDSTRERGYLIDFAVVTQAQVKEISLREIYDLIRKHKAFGSNELNIEAAAITESQVILFQRGGTRGSDLGIYFSRQEFLRWIETQTQLPAAPHIVSFQLPTLRGVAAGFSGASYVPELGKILFTASVEEGSDPIADGSVHGSFAGFLSLGEFPKIEAIAQIIDKAEPQKVESIAPLAMLSERTLRAVAVIDNDRGGSCLLELLIEI